MLNPSGLCQCGCGQPAPISSDTSARRGYVRGEPLRFIAGHNPRGRSNPRYRNRAERLSGGETKHSN